MLHKRNPTFTIEELIKISKKSIKITYASYALTFRSKYSPDISHISAYIAVL